jgi:uncharacterized protein (DUF2141 family)
MWNRNSTRIGLLLAGALVFSQVPVRFSAAGNEQGDQAAQGWLTFLEVLAGDQTKLQLALSQLEKAAGIDPTNQQNLFTLGRAYFYDAITHHNLASAEKAERIFARVLELNPKHDALAFHGSVLTILSQGKDFEKFRRGVEEMNRIVQHNPSSLNGRLSRSLTALGLPSQARTGKGNYDPLEDLEFASHAFEGVHSRYAPHAEVASKAFVGEAYLLRGDAAKAQAAFKAALVVSLPSEAEAKAGRILLQDIIGKRLNGSEQSLNQLLAQAGLGSCNTCHLRISNGTQSRLKAEAKTPEMINTSVAFSATQAGAEGELTVNITGLKSGEGQVRVALFDSEKTFLQKPFKSGVVAIENFQSHWQVKGVSRGFYALAVYHDRNNNGQLDKNLVGIPLEPYGFSNNARGVLGPPSFGDARFQVEGPKMRIEVHVE